MLHHVALETRPGDVAAEVRFWGALGFGEVAPPESLRARATWVERAGTQIHLLYAEVPVVAPAGHVAVVCADYAEALSRLSALGVELDERTRHWGSPRCVVWSPGGHRVEVMEFPPGRPDGA